MLGEWLRTVGRTYWLSPGRETARQARSARPPTRIPAARSTDAPSTPRLAPGRAKLASSGLSDAARSSWPLHTLAIALLNTLTSATERNHEATSDLRVSYGLDDEPRDRLREPVRASAGGELGRDLSPTGAATQRDEKHIPITLSTVGVLELLGGEPLPSPFELRQVGGHFRTRDQSTLVGGVPPVRPGRVYLAYLKPFQLHRDQPPIAGQYVSVGGSHGIFEHAGSNAPTDESARTFARSSPEYRDRPENVSVADARSSWT
jgi:hypothetical protein